MAIDWKKFVQQHHIKHLPLQEQLRLFKWENLYSDRLRALKESYTNISTSTPASSGGGGSSPDPTFTNTFSLNFDGTDDVLNFRSPTETALVSELGPMTISWWMKASTQVTPGFGALLLQGGSADGNSSSWFGSGIYIDGDLLIWTNLNATRYNLANASLGNQVTDNQWHHVVIQTNPDSTNRIDCIVDNGTRIQNTTDYRFTPGENNYFAHQSTITTIGKASGAGYNGLLDEFAFWPKQLTDEEITTLYNGGVPGDITSLSGGPTAWFRFEEGSGTAPIDTMGNETGVTISGTTYSSTTPS